MKPTPHRLAVIVAAVLSVLIGAATPADATSSGNSKTNFKPGCSATVVVSDTTTPGKVEVYGGWGCTATARLCPGFLTVIIYYRGNEVKRSKIETGFMACPQSLSHQVTYPDWSTSDGYKGAIIVSGAGGVDFTLTTGTIIT